MTKFYNGNFRLRQMQLGIRGEVILMSITQRAQNATVKNAVSNAEFKFALTCLSKS